MYRNRVTKEIQREIQIPEKTEILVAQLPQKLLIFITSNCGNRTKI